MTSSRRSSTPRGGKRPRALEAIAGRDPDPGRPVLGGPPEGPDPFAGPAPAWPPAEPTGVVPDVPASVGAYASELEALKYLVGYSLAMALPLARIEVGAVAVTFAPAGPRPGTVTNIGGGEPVDLYRTFGGHLYDQLQAQVREAVETPR